MADIVSCAEFWNVSSVLDAAVAHAPAARAMPSGQIITGTLRGLLPTGSAIETIDARDRLVRFTDAMIGVEYEWTVRELAEDLAKGAFCRTDGVYT